MRLAKRKVENHGNYTSVISMIMRSIIKELKIYEINSNNKMFHDRVMLHVASQYELASRCLVNEETTVSILLHSIEILNVILASHPQNVTLELTGKYNNAQISNSTIY